MDKSKRILRRNDMGREDSVYHDAKNRVLDAANPQIIPEEELHGPQPLFIASDMGAERYFKAKIKTPARILKNKVMIDIQYALQVGDILKIENEPTQYFIKCKLKKRTPFNNFTVQILRTDKQEMTDEDISFLSKGKKLCVIGMYQENPC